MYECYLILDLFLLFTPHFVIFLIDFERAPSFYSLFITFLNIVVLIIGDRQTIERRSFLHILEIGHVQKRRAATIANASYNRILPRRLSDDSICVAERTSTGKMHHSCPIFGSHTNYQMHDLTLVVH